MASRKTLSILLACAGAMPAQAQLLPRQGPVSGKIVSAKGGEQAQLLPEARLREAVVRQDLKTGDTLRTNATGTLAVVFADQTQVRLGRNTVLVVKAVVDGSPSAIRVQAGSLWARAPRGQSRLSVETPSATAAVRGTDWSLEVTDSATELQVFDGAIDFYNDQGRLSVSAGQAARARLGEAPSRIVTVRSTEREQMQYYIRPETIFEVLYPTTMPRARSIAERRRVLALPDAARSVDDWLALGEGGVAMQPKAEQKAILARLQDMVRTPAQDARMTLLAAWRAAEDLRFAEARDLFRKAEPGLDPDRAMTARFGAYVSAIRADPTLAASLAPPAADPSLMSSWIGQVFIAAYTGDTAAARVAAEEATRRFPDDAMGPAALAAVAQLIDDGALMEAAIAEGLRRDPNHPDVLGMKANYDANFRYRFADARTAYEAALANAPANSTLQANYATIQSQRSATRRTERIYRDAIAENPNDALLRLNHGMELLDENRVEAGKREIDTALALDPGLGAARIANARYRLQMGDAEAGFQEALAGSAADPGGSQSLLVLAMLYHRRGEYDVALQQIDAADRLDPAGPLAPLIRSAIALDRFDIDAAIVAAREAQRRSVALGGDFVNLSQSSDSGGYIASSFRAIGLQDWGRFYGDRLFEPFDSTGYFDRIATGTANPFVIAQVERAIDPEHGDNSDTVSNLMQGLAIEPLAIASPSRYLQLYRQRFVEASAGGGIVANGDDVRGNANVGLQGITFDPMPIAMSLTGSISRGRGPQGRRNDRRDATATALLSAELSPYDKIALFGNLSDVRQELPGDVDRPRDNGNVDANQKDLFAVYSHEFGRKSMLTLAASYSRSSAHVRREDIVDFTPGIPNDSENTVLTRTDLRTRGRTSAMLVSYAANLGIVDINIGAGFPRQIGRVLDRSVLIVDDISFPIDRDERARSKAERYHADVRITPSPNLVLQGQIASTESISGRVLDWRAGGAVQVATDHWLRAGWFRDTAFPGSFTLAPTRVAGLLPNGAPVPEGYRSKTLAVRWDGEWGKRLFTAVDYQRQRLGALSFSLPQLVGAVDTSNLFVADFGLASLSYLAPEIDRLSLSANAWLGGGFGLTANYARTWSHLPGVDYPDPTIDAVAGRVPFLPRNAARLGLDWASPRRITVRAALTYTGSRRYLEYPQTLDRAPIDRTLDDFVSADISADWELWDRRLLISAAVNNLFDAGYEVVSGVPGFGRTATLSATLRF